MRRCLLVLAVLFTLVSSVEAQRRRAVRHPGPAPVVPVADSVIQVGYFDTDNDGRLECLVRELPLVPTVAGTVIAYSVQKPGDGLFTPISYPYTVPESGKWRSGQLYFGEDFYDVLPDGTISAWKWGTAVFKVDTTSPAGLKTSMIYRVFVPVQPPTGSIDRAVVVDKDTILLLGPVSPKALLAGRTVDVSSTNVIKVPEGVFGTVPLTAAWLLPVSELFPSGGWECLSYSVPLPN